MLRLRRTGPNTQAHQSRRSESPAELFPEQYTLWVVVWHIFYGVCGFVLSQGFVLSMFWMAVGVMAGCVFWVLFCSVL